MKTSSRLLTNGNHRPEIGSDYAHLSAEKHVGSDVCRHKCCPLLGLFSVGFRSRILSQLVLYCWPCTVILIIVSKQDIQTHEA